MKTDLKGQLGRVLHSAVREIRKFAYSRPASSVQKTAPGRRRRVGLALGGGFARGIAHVGVLKVLLENAIPIDAIAGTSAGSLAAAAFASGCSINELTVFARKLRWSRLARWTFSRHGFASNERMEALLLDLLHCRSFEEAKIPLAVVAADLTTGEAVTFRDGGLILPIRASCSFPGLFIPVSYRGRLLVDGVIVGSVPAAALKEMGVDVIVGVHMTGVGARPRPTNLFQVVGESFQILEDRTQSSWRKHCDVVIEPKVFDARWDEFERADDLIAAGEAAARAALPALRSLLQAQPARAKAPSRAVPRPSTAVLQPDVTA
jgi:NTE family protein